MSLTSRALRFGAALFLVAAAALTVVWLLRDQSVPAEVQNSIQGPPSVEGEALHKYGPLDGGPRISLDEAKARSEYRLAIPPTNELTGAQTGIWMDSNGQVAFVWETELRMYVEEAEEIRTQEQADEHWDSAYKANADEGIEKIQVKGVSGLGYDGVGENPSSVNTYLNGVSIQLVSPSHSLAELLAIAEEISFE